MKNGYKIKVLHAASLLRPPAGILNQMQWEQEAAYELGLAWDVRLYCPVHSTSKKDITVFDESVDFKSLTKVTSKLKAWVQCRKNYYRWLMSLVNEYDIFVLRYYVHDPFQYWFVKNSPKPIYFVNHTLEVPELALSGGISGFIRSSCERLLGKYTLSNAEGVIGVTNEIIEYEKQRSGKNSNINLLAYPNGIVFNNDEIIDKRSEIPEILFVASYFDSWHGLDLLLDNLKSNKDKFVLHLVGELSDRDLEISKTDPRVILHGKLSHKEIKELSEKAWVGLSSFALNRKKMKEACTLKVREYLMLGLPVFAGYRDVFGDDFPFYMDGKPCIKNILSFGHDMRKASKSAVASASRKYIDKKILLTKLFSELENVVN
ncbi:glycosyltransferase [Spartinivicinus ruber]|uniref:glycosyltransferase n=1 Tax=Spartinivicinus ruber TaxID=2683272 RepID=UPI0013D0E109|nr:glycosyltransferase [Spartinivicinus ruber]